jgi:hypothetical protein
MPLSAETLDQYARFRGDSDMWCQSVEGRVDPAGADDWRLIDELIMKLRAIATVCPTPEFRRELEAQLTQHTPNAFVRARLLRLAEESATW